MSDTWIERASSLVVAAGDLLLGWSLRLPRDVTLLFVVALTITLLLAVRRLWTNQERLRRCRNDLVRLRELRREARRRDVAQLTRLDRTVAQVRLVQLKADLRVLAVVIVPFAGLAIWAAARLEYRGVAAGQPITLTAFTPLASVDRLAHVVPAPGFASDASWITRVEVDPSDGTRGRASWRLRFEEGEPPRSLPVWIRHGGESVAHTVWLEAARYSPPLQSHAAERLPLTSLELPEYRFLGIVPGWPRLGLAPWLVAYLLLSLALTPLAKRMTRIA